MFPSSFYYAPERRAERRLGRQGEFSRADGRDDRSSDLFEARDSARSEQIGRAVHHSARRSRCAQRDANVQDEPRGDHVFRAKQAAHTQPASAPSCG